MCLFLQESPRSVVSFRGASTEDKKSFPSARCAMLVSVGQHYHEGVKFKATVDFVNAKFKECIIFLGDALQRYNLCVSCAEKNPNNLFDLSINKGDEWLQRNKSVLQQFTIPLRVIRWSRWLNDKHFPSAYEKIKREIRKNANYKSTYVQSINEFLIRYRNRCNESDFSLNITFGHVSIN